MAYRSLLVSELYCYESLIAEWVTGAPSASNFSVFCLCCRCQNTLNISWFRNKRLVKDQSHMEKFVLHLQTKRTETDRKGKKSINSRMMKVEADVDRSVTRSLVWNWFRKLLVVALSCTFGHRLDIEDLLRGRRPAGSCATLCAALYLSRRKPPASLVGNQTARKRAPAPSRAQVSFKWLYQYVMRDKRPVKSSDCCCTDSLARAPGDRRSAKYTQSRNRDHTGREAN